MAIRLLFMIAIQVSMASSANAQRWDAEQAKAWAEKEGWRVGANFIPSTAVNQLEMWQAATFDPERIDRELAWAESIGMNTVRVYLHHLVWKEGADGYKSRIDRFLSIASRHQIKVVFVVFDDCWNENYASGKQPEPKVGAHNSQWVKDPGKPWYDGQAALESDLKNYVVWLLSAFKNDKRILMWDLYNEPGWSENFAKGLELSKKVFTWARSVNPAQPLTICIWNDAPEFEQLNKVALEQSDVITYHDYRDAATHARRIAWLKTFNRPLICTEYMARKHQSTFQAILPMLKAEGIGAINWGLVAGKTNTIYAWDEPRPDGSEPKLWFHDIFRKDGSPYDIKETELIRKLTMKNNE